jgi:hypothetical protein
MKTDASNRASPMIEYPAINLGFLPVEAINAVLGTELETGRVRLSRLAHRHMAEDHPEDYGICFAALAETIAKSFLHWTGTTPNR